MREIKYRAYDKEKNYMSKGNTLKNICLQAQEKIFYWDDNMPIMQYTGLKDKNGKEIYEGDLIQDGAGLILIVTFCNGRFCSTYNNSCETICGGIDNTDEIIGNIYQDKHLIK